MGGREIDQRDLQYRRFAHGGRMSSILFGCELHRTLVLARDERDIAKVDERDRSTVVVTRGAVHLECTLVKDTGAREVPRSDGDGAQHVQRRGDDGAVTGLFSEGERALSRCA